MKNLHRDDLWLNEAMASFLQNKAIDAVFSDLDLVRKTNSSFIKTKYLGFYAFFFFLFA